MEMVIIGMLLVQDLTDRHSIGGWNSERALLGTKKKMGPVVLCIPCIGTQLARTSNAILPSIAQCESPELRGPA